RVDVDVNGKKEEWLLLFKNETHNHPTEIEPFGGAATCVGGAIRDPLSGRAYVYGAMRVTGAANPLAPIEETIEGKLPQRKIVTTAAAGYSSYGNQIGLATGIVDEIYHPGYAAKRMEIGAVIAAAPAENVRRERPEPGDKVILLGGSTGRDGIGGATGASKAHNVHSVETCGAEVQKGNAPEERKLQRLFRNGEATKLIKRCNDFGAGGVSVAIGELAAGLDINLDMVPKKYEGLDGTELAISESQERMAVVVAAGDAEKFMKLAAEENLQSVIVATVQADPRLVLNWRGEKIVDLSRAFLDTNGAPKHIFIETAKGDEEAASGSLIDESKAKTLRDGMMAVASDLNTCSKQGLSERFDSTIGAGGVLMPFGGVNQITPVQAMVQKLPVFGGKTNTCSLMSFGYNPFITEKSPFHGAYLAVVESVSKLIASGAEFEDVYLTFQEYFEKLGKDSKRWGQPFAALLGAFKAQMDLGIAAIGGKDSMSGSFEKLDVPPTLVSFAVTTGEVDKIISPEFKEAGHPVILIQPEIGVGGLPTKRSLLEAFDIISEMVNSGRAISCYTLGMGGTAEAIMKMCFGNKLGFAFKSRFDTGIKEIFNYNYGAFVVELSGPLRIESILDRRSGHDRRGPERATAGRRSGGERRKELCCKIVELGNVTAEPTIVYGGEEVGLDELYAAYTGKLESVYPTKPLGEQKEGAAAKTYARTKSTGGFTAGKSAAIKVAKPRVLIPAFPGTNCEWDSAAAIERAGGEAEILVINNLSSAGIADSIERFAKSLAQSQMVFIPGGFSGGDEPDGSAKFITAFFRNERIKEGVTDLLENRDGLMCGICNGFQALIKLGLVPYGKIIDTDEKCATLTLNKIGRHQSRIVRTRIVSNRSPWLALTNETGIYSVPISHGEGRFIAPESLVRELFASGRVATQYVDLSGKPSDDVRFNPNGSTCAIEGILSPDGRVFGKMGHAERIGNGLYKNVPGNYDMKMFESAVAYYK
ncbi:MAG: phosphoribosylformylglycinamidine synthase, partial [Firmicutes bacterium]|nr:phosphoribosylformylglycinamidine synthase [Bacillota bacterium]